jgi:hypothetical protein
MLCIYEDSKPLVLNFVGSFYSPSLSRVPSTLSQVPPSIVPSPCLCNHGRSNEGPLPPSWAGVPQGHMVQGPCHEKDLHLFDVRRLDQRKSLKKQKKTIRPKT